MEQIDLVDHFLNNFQLLTPKQQKVWRYLQSYAKHYRNVFPSHAKIAEACTCHRDTVIEAIKKFKNMGWLRYVKRAYTSCVYYLADVLVCINTLNSQTFEKKNFSHEPDINSATDPTVMNTNKSKLIKNEFEKNENVQKLAQEGIVFSVKDLAIFQALAKKNQQAMDKAFNDCLTLSKKEGIRNPGALVTARWKAHNTASLRVVEEVKHLEISESDKKILTRYSKENRKAFLFALEDFSTYKVSQKVKNIAAFITNRFNSYTNKNEKDKEEKNVDKSSVENLLSKFDFPREISVFLGEKYVEFSFGCWSNVFEYKDLKFETKLKSLLSKYNHFRRT